MNALRLELSQKLNMTQQLVQAVSILAMSGQEINDLIDKEVLENPVLELIDTSPTALDERWTQSYKQNAEASDSFTSFTQQQENLHDYLMAQVVLQLRTEEEKAIAEYIIGSLNESGYLEQPLTKIAQNFSADLSVIEKIKAVIQDLEPPGFASAGVPEFLLLQLKKLPQNDKTSLAQLIIAEHLLALAQRDFEIISLATGQNVKLIQQAADLIRSLNPRPVNAWLDKGQAQYITPDILIEKVQDKYLVSLNPLYTRRLKIQDDYTDLRKKVDKETKKYITKNLRSAQWIMQCLEQREKTIRKISEILVELQKDFLDFGLLYMKPYTLKQVAQLAEVHESTVSRTINGKYAQTPHGTLPLKAFFPSGLMTFSGQKINSTQIKKRIAEIIKAHGKISDKKIAQILTYEGISIARRTVAKYRSTVGLQSSFTRKT